MAGPRRRQQKTAKHGLARHIVDADPGLIEPAKTNGNYFPDFWTNPGPGRRTLDSGRGDVEFAGVFASVESLTVSFVDECMLWEAVGKTI